MQAKRRDIEFKKKETEKKKEKRRRKEGRGI